MGEAAFDEPERADTERVVIVLRRDQMRSAQPGGETSVDIGVHEMRMHDVGAQRPCKSHEQQRVEVAWRQDPHSRNLERAVEVARAPRRIIEPYEDRL